MIIEVKSTKMQLVFPDGYEKLKAKNLLYQIKNIKESFEAYHKVTSNANCIVLIHKVDQNNAMNFDDLQRLIDGIHGALGDNQGLIVAENGVTERNYRFIYSIVREIVTDGVPKAVYILRMNLEQNGYIAEINADFTEIGTTGQRDSMGSCFAHMAGIVKALEDGIMSGWREDPYDASFKRGLPMNLSEREGLDGLFPDHPLSQAREFVHAVLTDELMLSVNDPDYDGTESNVEAGAEQINEAKETNNACNENDEMSKEELYRLLMSKDVKRRFIAKKIEVEKRKKDKFKLPEIDIKAAIKKGAEVSEEGIVLAKEGAILAGEGVAKAASVVKEKSKEAQMAVLSYADKKKNARFLKAKLTAFEDGMKEGKVQAVDYIKKYANFCLASAAISYYFARCDGNIDEAEMLEIEHDLDSIIKNKDLPNAMKNKLVEISENENLTFNEVCQYLDGVGIETLQEFSRDVDEIIFADGTVTSAEEKAKVQFDAYLVSRMETSEK